MSLAEKIPVFILERQIRDYTTHGSIRIDFRQVFVNVGGSEVPIAAPNNVRAGTYSLKVRDLAPISPVARVWINYEKYPLPQGAPVMMLASERLNQPGKSNIPEDALEIKPEAGQILDSLDFIISTTHPNLPYDRPIRLTPIYGP